MEKAYYSKYVELAEKYGTYSLYDYYNIKDGYLGYSYLNGVCVVNLMDFNGDGIQDLLVIYSNKQMDKIISDGSDLEVYELPTENTYEFEIWTYKDGGLLEILHEPGVSLCYTYPNQTSDFWLVYYRNFINIYENEHGFPVIQIYDESDQGCKYTNIFYSDGKIVRDELVSDGGSLQMNGLEVAETIWSENVAGYNKIVLSTLLADSSHTSSSLFTGYNIDYNNTLLQTKRVIKYLSGEDETQVVPNFHVEEGEYISLYLEEIERANRLCSDKEFTEEHYFTLYDINQDGISELILYESTYGAGTHFHFYTIMNGELINCGDYGRTNLYFNDEGGLIAYFGRMGGYQIDKITLEDGAIVITEIAEGNTQEEYPELEEYGYNNYQYLPFCPPAIPLTIYTYSQE